MKDVVRSAKVLKNYQNKKGKCIKNPLHVLVNMFNSKTKKTNKSKRSNNTRKISNKRKKRINRNRGKKRRTM